METIVALHEVVETLFDILLGCGKQVGLECNRPFLNGYPDGDNLLFTAPKSQIVSLQLWIRVDRDQVAVECELTI